MFCQKKPGLGLKTSGLVTWSDFASIVSLSHCGLRQESGRVIPTSQRYCEGQVMTRELPGRTGPGVKSKDREEKRESAAVLRPGGPRVVSGPSKENENQREKGRDI